MVAGIILIAILVQAVMWFTNLDYQSEPSHVDPVPLIEVKAPTKHTGAPAEGWWDEKPTPVIVSNNFLEKEVMGEPIIEHQGVVLGGIKSRAASCQGSDET